MYNLGRLGNKPLNMRFLKYKIILKFNSQERIVTLCKIGLKTQLY